MSYPCSECMAGSMHGPEECICEDEEEEEHTILNLDEFGDGDISGKAPDDDKEESMVDHIMQTLALHYEKAKALALEEFPLPKGEEYESISVELYCKDEVRGITCVELWERDGTRGRTVHYELEELWDCNE